MSNKFSNGVRRVVRQEMARRLVSESESGELPPRFAKTWVNVPAAKRAAFGAMVKAHFNRSIPTELADADVMAYVDKTPTSATISPVGLVDIFKNAPQIRAGLGKEKAQAELDAIEQAKENGTLTGKGKHGDTSYETMGKALGVTDAGATIIANKGQKMISKFLGGVSPEDMEQEDIEDVFGPGGKFDTAVSTAADLYTKILKASKGNVDSVFGSLTKGGVLLKGESDMLQNAERVAVQHLADMTSEGQGEKVKALLIKDIDRDDNIVKSFQNMVSKVIRKDIDAASIEAGEKRARGRPKGSKNKIKP